jgi:hypothetical protein
MHLPINVKSPNNISKWQVGFNSAFKGLKDQCFWARVLILNSVYYTFVKYVIFIDFEKAFDSVKKKIMWSVLKVYSIPRKITQIIKILYESFKCKVRS